MMEITRNGKRYDLKTRSWQKPKNALPAGGFRITRGYNLDEIKVTKSGRFCYACSDKAWSGLLSKANNVICHCD